VELWHCNSKSDTSSPLILMRNCCYCAWLPPLSGLRSTALLKQPLRYVKHLHETHKHSSLDEIVQQKLGISDAHMTLQSRHLFNHCGRLISSNWKRDWHCGWNPWGEPLCGGWSKSHLRFELCITFIGSCFCKALIERMCYPRILCLLSNHYLHKEKKLRWSRLRLQDLAFWSPNMFLEVESSSPQDYLPVPTCR